MTNWVPLPNPHGLASPPEWWLSALADLHPRIVLFPGITEKVYRVGERVNATRLIKNYDPGTEAGRMIQHGCIPVVSLLPTIAWNQDFFEWLDRHDLWSVTGKPEGSGQAAADRLDAQDREREAAIERAMADEADQIGSSAYWGLLARRGNLVFLSGDHRKTSIPEVRQSGDTPAPE